MGSDHKIGFGLRDLIGDRLADLVGDGDIEGKPSFNRLLAQAIRDGYGSLSPDQLAVLETAIASPLQESENGTLSITHDPRLKNVTVYFRGKRTVIPGTYSTREAGIQAGLEFCRFWELIR